MKRGAHNYMASGCSWIKVRRLQEEARERQRQMAARGELGEEAQRVENQKLIDEMSQYPTWDPNYIEDEWA